ncbi:MAG: iron-sulfur cluster assembly scaffold protein [Patescibacteria group bacterium]
MGHPYEKIILEHYRWPRHRGRLTKPTASFSAGNPSCGDQLTIDVTTDHAGKIIAVGWEASGCAISQAAASWFSDFMLNKKLTAIQNLPPEKFLAGFTAHLSPGRLACALLPLTTIKRSAD